VEPGEYDNDLNAGAPVRCDSLPQAKSRGCLDVFRQIRRDSTDEALRATGLDQRPVLAPSKAQQVRRAAKQDGAVGRLPS
jgi:hypothetical protein